MVEHDSHREKWHSFRESVRSARLDTYLMLVSDAGLEAFSLGIFIKGNIGQSHPSFKDCNVSIFDFPSLVTRQEQINNSEMCNDTNLTMGVSSIGIIAGIVFGISFMHLKKSYDRWLKRATKIEALESRTEALESKLLS